MRAAVLSLLTAVCVLGLAACGSSGSESSGTTTDAAAQTVRVGVYTGLVCSALSRWLNDIANASAVFANTTNNESDLRKVRAQFVTYFGGAIDETDRMVAEVKTAGTPDLPKGRQVSAAMRNELGTFKPLLLEAQRRARKLPIGNPERFTMRAQTLGAGFHIETTKLETVFDVVAQRFDEPRLAEAAAADASCQNLGP